MCNSTTRRDKYLKKKIVKGASGKQNAIIFLSAKIRKKNLQKVYIVWKNRCACVCVCSVKTTLIGATQREVGAKQQRCGAEAPTYIHSQTSKHIQRYRAHIHTYSFVYYKCTYVLSTLK